MRHTLAQLQSGALAGTARLQLSCGLTRFPIEILQLADTLEVLDLSGNQLSTLPQEFAQLTSLKVLFLSNNPFTEFPEVVGQCLRLEMIGFKACQLETVPENAIPPSCRWLILTDNRLQKLPDSIGNCLQLQKLMLAGNRLHQLPPALANCQRLELLRISANHLPTLPTWLFTLPRLAWLAFAGNPCSERHGAPAKIQETSWKELGIGEKLGEGASGIIYKAKVQPDRNLSLPRDVAVKVFKGSVTSNGLPEDEMAACLVAGWHPYLVKTVAVLTNHPEQKQGLLMKLIPEGYSHVGGPPNFATITRDTFEPGTVFTLPQVLHLAKGMAGVAVHLHAKGVLHGDLYAHNILMDTQGNPLFGDFGAATVYDRTDAPLADHLERLEVRAFGCLLEDLLQHLVIIHSHQQAHVLALQALCRSCLQENLLLRPVFLEVVAALEKLTMSL